MLVVGLADGRIMLYDLDGGDSTEAKTSSASVARSVPLEIEAASGDAVWGLCTCGPMIAVARGRLSVRLLDVRRSRKVVASMTVANENNIVAALYQQMQRTGAVMLLQDEGSLSSLEWRGGRGLKLRCRKRLEMGAQGARGFTATALDVHWGVYGLGCVAAVACSATADSGRSAHVLLVDGVTLSVLRTLQVNSHGIRAALLQPLQLLLGAAHQQQQQQRRRSQQEKKQIKGSEFQNLALVCACADGTLLFDRCVAFAVCGLGLFCVIVLMLATVAVAVIVMRGLQLGCGGGACSPLENCVMAGMRVRVAAGDAASASVRKSRVICAGMLLMR